MCNCFDTARGAHFAQKVRCEPSPPDILPITNVITGSIEVSYICVSEVALRASLYSASWLFCVYRAGNDCDDAPVYGAK